MATINEFKRYYTKAIQNGDAAIFAGAGLSKPAGYVDWKELLRDIAEDISLDVDKESDLVEVTQFYFNEKNNRSEVNNRILNKFKFENQETASMNLLAQMPIKTYWTTNYDHLIEETLQKSKKQVDVKITSDNLSTSLSDRDVIVYKMHGDCLIPGDCVITKDDYELYNEKRQLFSTALQGDLVSKTFLFIGFSFEDPNLKYILSRIKVLLDKNVRNHYCFLEKIDRKEYTDDQIDEYEYNLNKQNLRINDLKRYGINAVLLDSYDEIPKILESIRRSIKNNCIFISGAAHEYGSKWQEKGPLLIRKLTKKLYEKDYKIITGHARGIGSYIISTILEESESNITKINKHLSIKAFPYEDNNRIDYESIKYDYRQGIFQEAGIVIFMFGNKNIGNKTVSANGVYEEFKIAKEHGAYIIPVGTTGYVSEKIFKEIEKNIEEYSYLDSELEILRSSQDIDSIVDSIMSIICCIQRTI